MRTRKLLQFATLSLIAFQASCVRPSLASKKSELSLSAVNCCMQVVIMVAYYREFWAFTKVNASKAHQNAGCVHCQPI